jgi:hypothetical protein
MANNISQQRSARICIDSMQATDGKASIDDKGILRGLCPVTRCGVFLYMNPDGTERRELRPRDEVFSPHALESMKMIPITLNHPLEGYVDANIAKRDGIGSTGETIKEAGDFVFSSIMVYDPKAIEAIRTNRICELSLGYVSDIEDIAGEYEGEVYDCIQRNIKYNHLSVVEKGRAGSNVRIITDGVCMSKNDKQEIPRDPELKAPMSAQTLNNEFFTSIQRVDSRVDAIEAAVKGIGDKVDSFIEKMEKRKEDEEEKEDSCVHSAENKLKEDSAEVEALAARRAKYLVEAYSRMPFDEAHSLSTKKTNEIRDAVIASLCRNDSISLEGKSDDYIEAFFDINFKRKSVAEKNDGKFSSSIRARESIAPKTDSTEKPKIKFAKDVVPAALNIERE